MSSDRTSPPREHSVSEQTPLLGEQPVSVRPSEESPVPLVKDPTTKELILVLGSIWVGVFLAALGMIFNSVISVRRWLTIQTRQSLLR